MPIRDLIQALPKAELHVHIEGTLEPELMHTLAKKNKIYLRYQTVEEIRETYNFHNLQSFLDIYYQGAAALRSEGDFYDLCAAYLRRAHDDNVVHTEIFFDPQTHIARGISFPTVINGLVRAVAEAETRWGLTSHLLMCFLRDQSEEDAFDTLARATPHLDQIKGVGLDSAEVGNPPSKFKQVFEVCRDHKLEVVAHAGEEGPPEYIWEALDVLHVSRIDHGVRCLEDEKLVERLRSERIPLTVCPLSKLKLAVVKDLKDHNLKKLLQNGLCATVNSDDPAYFGGYVNQNYLETAEALGLEPSDLKQLAKNSFEAAWISEERRNKLIQQIDLL